MTVFFSPLIFPPEHKYLGGPPPELAIDPFFDQLRRATTQGDSKNKFLSTLLLLGEGVPVDQIIEFMDSCIEPT